MKSYFLVSDTKVNILSKHQQTSLCLVGIGNFSGVLVQIACVSLYNIFVSYFFITIMHGRNNFNGVFCQKHNWKNTVYIITDFNVKMYQMRVLKWRVKVDGRNNFNKKQQKRVDPYRQSFLQQHSMAINRSVCYRLIIHYQKWHNLNRIIHYFLQLPHRQFFLPALYRKEGLPRWRFGIGSLTCDHNKRGLHKRIIWHRFDDMLSAAVTTFSFVCIPLFDGQSRCKILYLLRNSLSGLFRPTNNKKH